MRRGRTCPLGWTRGDPPGRRRGRENVAVSGGLAALFAFRGALARIFLLKGGQWSDDSPDPLAPRPVEAAALTRLVFGEHALDLATGELRWRGEPVALEPQPAKVLRHLALHSGEIVTREDLHRLLWGEDTHVEADQGLNYCIKELRRALGDEARNPTFIETLTRRGYRFLPPVELRGPEEGPAAGGSEGASGPGPRAAVLAAVPRAGTDPGQGPRSEGWLRSRAGMASAATAFAVLAVVATVWLSGRLRPQPLAAEPEPVAVTAGNPRIAVLLFDTAEDAADDEAVARSLASQLVSEMVGGAGPGFEVIASTTSFAYRGAGKTIGQIGRELRAAYVVEGAFHRSGAIDGTSTGTGGGADGGEARLCVRLVDTREEVVVWTGSFTSAPGRLDELPRAAADAISDVLRASV